MMFFISERSVVSREMFKLIPAMSLIIIVAKSPVTNFLKGYDGKNDFLDK